MREEREEGEFFLKKYEGDGKRRYKFEKKGIKDKRCK